MSTRTAILAIGLPALGLVVAGALLVPGLLGAEPGKPAAAVSVSTVPVTAGDMASETKVVGAIAYARTEPVTAGIPGVITELPAPGAPVAAGGVLYRINTLPVVLLQGTLPAWRDFTPDMSDGDDVLQLEQNLAAFGLFGETPDAEFDWDTTVAIREWQRSLGIERTGVVERSTVLFFSGELRVDQVTARVGQDVAPGTPLYEATSPEKVVDLLLKSQDRDLAVAGETVTVALPGGGSIDGVIQTVGAPFSKPNPDGNGSSVVVSVRVTLADQDAVADLALASVTVSFSSPLRSDVLTVPVDALVPLDDTHYAVELPRKDAAAERTLLPVEVGASSAGRVEISGTGIVAGLLVVVPNR